MIKRDFFISGLVIATMLSCGKPTPIEQKQPFLPEEQTISQGPVKKQIETYNSKNFDLIFQGPPEVDSTSVDTFACKLRVSLGKKIKREKLILVLTPTERKNKHNYQLKLQQTTENIWVEPGVYQLKVKIENDSAAIPAFLTHAGSTYGCRIEKK